MSDKPSNETWVLTRLVDASNPVWDKHATIVGTLKQIRAMFDLSNGVPFGWRLLKGKQARRWIRHSLNEELRYQRDKKAREKTNEN